MWRKTLAEYILYPWMLFRLRFTLTDSNLLSKFCFHFHLFRFHLNDKLNISLRAFESRVLPCRLLNLYWCCIDRNEFSFAQLKSSRGNFPISQQFSLTGSLFWSCEHMACLIASHTAENTLNKSLKKIAQRWQNHYKSLSIQQSWQRFSSCQTFFAMIKKHFFAAIQTQLNRDFTQCLVVTWRGKRRIR